MRFIAAVLIGITATTSFAQAQAPAVQNAPTVAMPSFAGVTIGETLAAIRARLGDPIRADAEGEAVIWRFLEANGAYFLDVLGKNNVATSVTVIARFDTSPFTDERGISFGESPDQVRAKLGSPTKTSTNADDGSLDLWYLGSSSGWVYEFKQSRLGFIQLIVPPNTPFGAGPPVELGDGSSPDRAIRPVATNLLAGTDWPHAYLQINSCGDNGRWVEKSSRSQDNKYDVIHAQCSSDKAERDFYFDTTGYLGSFLAQVTAAVKNGHGGTVTLDNSGGPVYVQTDPSASPSYTPGSSGGTSFADAIAIEPTSEHDGAISEFGYLTAHPCLNGIWHLEKQATVKHGGKSYDVLSVACRPSGPTRDFYFYVMPYAEK